MPDLSDSDDWDYWIELQISQWNWDIQVWLTGTEKNGIYRLFMNWKEQNYCKKKHTPV